MHALYMLITRRLCFRGRRPGRCLSRGAVQLQLCSSACIPARVTVHDLCVCVSIANLSFVLQPFGCYNSNINSDFCNIDNHVPTCFLSLFEPFTHLDTFLIETL